ncbi:MAG: class I fructose-bisphosphate aldolase [Patescibacteria group bacterium]
MDQGLNNIANAMVVSGKGILAADESFGTIEKRFAKINLPSTEEHRRAYREMLFTAPGIGEYISGVILFDETIRQRSKDGVPFVEILQKGGVIPGIKVDQGTKAMDVSSGEKVTKGLEGLTGRLEEYMQLGAKFAKWRAVITIGDWLPTEANIRQNAKDLAAYAFACQQVGLVPIVEPEVLMDGAHTMERCEEVSRQTLRAVFEALDAAGVHIPGMILKTNMVVPGKLSGQSAKPAEIAAATVSLFKEILPDSLPGEAFLSGGQSEIEATENLNEINKLGPFPWRLTFSYGRALQDSALKTWNGRAENVVAAQQRFLHRARMNSLATVAGYSKDTEVY